MSVLYFDTCGDGKHLIFILIYTETENIFSFAFDSQKQLQR